MDLLSHWAVYQKFCSNLVAQVALTLSCHSGNLGLVRRDSCSCLSLGKKKLQFLSRRVKINANLDVMANVCDLSTRTFR